MYSKHKPVNIFPLGNTIRMGLIRHGNITVHVEDIMAKYKQRQTICRLYSTVIEEDKQNKLIVEAIKWLLRDFYIGLVKIVRKN